MNEPPLNANGKRKTSGVQHAMYLSYRMRVVGREERCLESAVRVTTHEIEKK